MLDQRTLQRRASLAPLLLDLPRHVQHHNHLRPNLHAPRAPQHPLFAHIATIHLPHTHRRHLRITAHDPLPTHLHRVHGASGRRPHLRAGGPQGQPGVLLRRRHDDQLQRLAGRSAVRYDARGDCV